MRAIIALLIIGFLAHPVFVANPAFSADDQETVYVCPMHPHISGEHGDNCPICGMQLVAREPAQPAAPADGDKPEIRVSPAFVQALGVTVAEVEQRSFGQAIRAYGEVVASSRNEVVVNMRSQGWITALATNAEGDTVKKGELLFTYYSPEILAAQVDFKLAQSDPLKSREAERRLRLYGMDDKAIAEFKAAGQVIEHTPFYSPIDGTVIKLNSRRGAFVKAGENVLRMQDFNQVWVNAAVPLRDLAFLAVGQKATISQPETGQHYQSQIDFIHHVADPTSRTATVRLILPHRMGEPKPNSFVDVEFEADIQTRLAVPAEAIFYDSQGAHVFLALGDGRFQPIAVTTGISAQGWTEIRSGLQAGQTIVRSGQFLLDAESQLGSGFSRSEDSTAPAAPSHTGGAAHVH